MAKTSKVVYGNQVLIDLTQDTVASDNLLFGYKATGADGESVIGACTFDADTTDATIQYNVPTVGDVGTSSEILNGKTAYAGGYKVQGTMENRGGVTGSISTKEGQYTIQSGYHDGSGKVGIDATEKAKIIAGNIKSGVDILGVTGTYSGEAGTGQSKTVTPYTTEQTVLPDAGYDYLTQVKINAIEYVETPNSAGGTTVKIGTVAS